MTMTLAAVGSLVLLYLAGRGVKTLPLCKTCSHILTTFPTHIRVHLTKWLNLRALAGNLQGCYHRCCIS